MQVTVEIGGRLFRAHTARALSLAIPVDAASPRVLAFGVQPPTAERIVGHGFVGDTRRGGSCNVAEHRLVPHCHGTHTECVGHLVDEPLSVIDVLRETLIPATLVSVTPETVADGDRQVTDQSLRAALAALEGAGPHDAPFHRAIVLRTLPNGTDKLRARYDGAAPPAYLTAAAGAYLAQLGCEHLVVDLPSLDRMVDGGKLAAHRAFFGLPPGSRTLAEATRRHCTATELAFVPDEVVDGHYLLDLQLAPLAGDAVPSRPLLLALEAVTASGHLQGRARA
jgi:arylformamidase